MQKVQPHFTGECLRVATLISKIASNWDTRVHEIEAQLLADHKFAMELGTEHRRSKASTRNPTRLLPGSSEEMSPAQTRAIVKSLNQGSARMPPMPRRADASASYTPDLDPRLWKNDWMQHQRK